MGWELGMKLKYPRFETMADSELFHRGGHLGSEMPRTQNKLQLENGANKQKTFRTKIVPKLVLNNF